MGDTNLERARHMDAKFMNMDFDAVPVGQPIDERSLLAAASIKNVPTMEQMLTMHNRSKQAHEAMIQKSWSNYANALPRVQEDTPSTRPSTRPSDSAPVFPDLAPKRTNAVFQTYKDIAYDLKNFSSLPQKTILQKLQSCFFDNGRAYVSVTSFLAFCIIMIIVIVICIGARRP
jgi:hypothetical protein